MMSHKTLRQLQIDGEVSPSILVAKQELQQKRAEKQALLIRQRTITLQIIALGGDIVKLEGLIGRRR